MESYYPGDDEKWKLSKKGRSRSMGQAAGTTMLSRSYSASVVGATTRGVQQQQQAHHRRHYLPPPAAASSTSQSGAGLSKKCVDAVKEHRARFYIVRRCVSMLVCWRDQ
jgi:hypothetical protein